MFTIPDLKLFAETYRRIGRDLFRMSSLWLAEDHLVYVKGWGFLMPFLEEYRRFRYADIEAITVVRTSRFGKGFFYLFFVAVSSASVALIFSLATTIRPVTIAVAAFFILIGLAALAMLLRHLILGPTCVCELQTGLTRERLRPLTRYHRTLRTIAAIEPLVREAQSEPAGHLSPDEGGSRDPVRQDGSFRSDRFQVPVLVPTAFGLFLVLGLTGLAGLHLESVALTAGVLLMILSGSLLLTMTLVLAVRRVIPDSLRIILWITMGIHFLVVAAGGVYFLMTAISEPAYTIGLVGPLEAFTGIATNGGAVFYTIFAVLFLGFFVAGLWGLTEAEKWRRLLKPAGDRAPGAGRRNE